MNLQPKSQVIVKLTAKDVWGNGDTHRIEEKKMSPLVKKYIDEIAHQIGYDELEIVGTEQFIGDFRADIICKDATTNDIIIIENMLDKLDHDHLGKAFTYMANYGAKNIVWICEKVRDEHKKAIELLNEITSEDYHFNLFELHFSAHKNDLDNGWFEFVPIILANPIDKISSSLKGMVSEGAKTSYNFLLGLEEDIKKNFPKYKIHDAKHLYLDIGGFIPSFWLQIGMSAKTNKASVGIVISDRVKDADKCEKAADLIIKKLVDKGYDYNFVKNLGKRNQDYIKYNYDTDLGVGDEDKIIEILKNMYNTMYEVLLEEKMIDE